MSSRAQRIMEMVKNSEIKENVMNSSEMMIFDPDDCDDDLADPDYINPQSSCSSSEDECERNVKNVTNLKKIAVLEVANNNNIPNVSKKKYLELSNPDSDEEISEQIGDEISNGKQEQPKAKEKLTLKTPDVRIEERVIEQDRREEAEQIMDQNGESRMDINTCENNESKKKKKRCRTSTERLENERRKHPLIDIGECCSKKCYSEIDTTQREQIHDHFWELNNDCRKIWINNHVSEMLAKRKVQDTRRTYTRTYKFPIFKESGKVNFPVCQQFFLKTLGYKSTSVIDHTLKCCKDEHGNQRLTPLPDQRGRHAPKNKKDITDLQEHILSYKPRPSHYKREHAPKRLYLPSDLSIKSMHHDYSQKFPLNPVGYELYRKTVDAMNIAFYNVHSVKCGFCIQADMNPTPENLAEKEVHLKEVQLRRQMYQEDASKNTQTCKVFAVDMQKVFMLPRMPQLQEAFFLSRLVVFNETFASMQKKEKHHCILWHEATAGRKAEEVACSFLKFLDMNRDTKNIILWLDNCSGQNKNWVLFSSLLCYVNSDLNTIESITLKYLLTGHTFMAADGLHGKIEQVIRKKGNIEDFQDFVDACQTSSQRMCVTELKISDFKKLESKFKTLNRKSDYSIPYLKDLVCVKFCRGEKEVSYKTDFKSEEYTQTRGCIKKGAILSLPKETPMNHRGISVSKKQGIVEQLVPKMKSSRRAFWLNLHENPNAPDILDEGI